MSGFAAVAFWLALASLVYTYAGFPLLVVLVGTVRRRSVQTRPITPTMSLVIAAYNEADGIAQRLDNALTLDYPAEALEIIVASDGSSDATEAIVASYVPRGVRLLRLPRRGKLSALVDAVQLATGEILVFSDANTVVGHAALRALARNFADPAVGGVAGHTSYRLEPGSESSSRGESLYWRYDTWLKEMESRAGSVVSAHGGLYALRRELFRAPRDFAVTDDFFISTCAVESGCRLVFERDALAWEVAVPKAQREFSRRVRLMTRGLRGVMLRRDLLNPARYGFYAVVLFSHKVARRLVPVALLILLGSSLLLSPRGGPYRAAAIGQLVFYVLAGAGWLTRAHAVGQHRLLYVPFYYCMANTAAMVAIANLLRGERIERWQPQRHVVGAP
jgi:cellulose synthase/poly-beta-1,6-N-acetylglucosamine synthase-like glycosyltransferase